MANLETEFTKKIPVDKVSDAQLTYKLTASAEACKKIAQRLGILDIDKFEAEVSIYKKPDLKAIFVEGKVKGSVKQACILTGAPVAEEIEDSFESYFVANEEKLEKLEEIDPAFLYEDVEILQADHIDLAELATQYLSLFLDPYPKRAGADVTSVKKAGVTIKTEEDFAEEMRQRKNPFNVLKGLKKD